MILTKTEMLITLAWRQRILDADSPDRYYFTEYSTLWVVYADEKQKICCSEPLYFAGNMPTLERDFLVFNRYYNTWYYFLDGIA